GVMADGQAEQRPRAVVETLVESGIKRAQGVGVFGVDQLAGKRDLAGDAAAKGNADLLVVKPGGGDGPQLFAVLVDQENRATLGLHLRARDLEDQLQQLGQVERGVQQARGFKEQRELVDALVFFLRSQNVVELGRAHLGIQAPPEEKVLRDLAGGVHGEHAGKLS